MLNNVFVNKLDMISSDNVNRVVRDEKNGHNSDSENDNDTLHHLLHTFNVTRICNKTDSFTNIESLHNIQKVTSWSLLNFTNYSLTDHPTVYNSFSE